MNEPPKKHKKVGRNGMKQLVCDLCGSTDMIKQDGVFVCQGCGTKYSVEEARRMMMDVPGSAPVTSTANVDSLYNLAVSSLESKNYAKAEDFCNQVLSMNDRHFNAWFLKAKAVNGQIKADNPRIDEVVNCIATAYRVCPDGEKGAQSHSLLDWLIRALKVEITFWLLQVEVDRPTEVSVKRAKNAYIGAWNNAKKVSEEMGIDATSIKEIGYDLDNYFIKEAIRITEATWKSTVAYNYYRDKYRNGQWSDSNYRPMEKIYRTFRSEINRLEDLLQVCLDNANSLTPLELLRQIYVNKKLFYTEYMNAKSWKPMVRTRTNGYGAVISRREYWDEEYSPTREAKESLRAQIAKCEALIIGYDQKIADKKQKAYWDARPEQKASLEKEKNKLNTQIYCIEAAYVLAPGKVGLKAFTDEIAALTQQRDALGLFKSKEKAEFNAKIEDLNKTVSEIQSRTAPLRNRLQEVERELTSAH